jgi:hemoglobin
MVKHIELNQKIALKKEHFDRWEILFIRNVDDLFQGTVADEAKKRASLMAQLMSFKVAQSTNKHFIQ